MNPAIALILGRPLPASMDDTGWRNALAITDRTLATPLLGLRPDLPAWVRDEVDVRSAKVVQRRSRLLETYRDAANALQQNGTEFVLLKGFTHEADGNIEPVLRAQGDIDLLCPPAQIGTAREALLACGFTFHPGSELSDNHERPLLKPHQWNWHGDYFDPDQPVPVELHRTIWDSGRDRIELPGLEAFWERREWITATGLRVPVYCDVDRLGIAALHLLRHVLRNNLRPGHAWELAQMLARREQDREFWDKWRSLHPGALRGLETIAFRLATEWFGGELPSAARSDWDALPQGVHAWFDRYAFSPLENLTQPNKDVLWLHLALLPKRSDRWAVARRRLLPSHVPTSEEATAGYVGHVWQRGHYHALALARVLWRATVRSNTSHTSD